MANLIKPNLFNGKLEVLLSREDIYEIAKYAIHEHIIDISLDVQIDDEYLWGVTEPKKLHDLDYDLSFVEAETIEEVQDETSD